MLGPNLTIDCPNRIREDEFSPVRNQDGRIAATSAESQARNHSCGDLGRLPSPVGLPEMDQPCPGVREHHVEVAAVVADESRPPQEPLEEAPGLADLLQSGPRSVVIV